MQKNSEFPLLTVEEQGPKWLPKVVQVMKEAKVLVVLLKFLTEFCKDEKCKNERREYSGEFVAVARVTNGQKIPYIWSV